jgi:hypothetical protein
MREEFRYSKATHIFAYITLIGFLILACVIFYFGIIKDGYQVDSWWMILISIILLVLNIFLYIDIKSRLIYIDVKNKVIGRVNAINTLEYSFSEIKGFSINENYLILHPNPPLTKVLQIPISYIEKTDELFVLLASNFKNLDEEEAENSVEELLNDERLGYNETSRLENFTVAKKVSKILNVVSYIVALLFLLFPRIYFIQYALCAILPLVIVFIYKKYNGVIKLEELKNDVYPTLIFGLVTLVIVVFYRAIIDYKIIDNNKTIWINLSIASAILFTMFYSLVNGIQVKTSKVLFFGSIFFLILLYTYGNMIILNTMLDKSKPKIFTPKIVNKHMIAGKNATYYIKPEKWNNLIDAEDLEVSSSQYINKQIGDSLIVYCFSGAFKIPHYFYLIK